MTTEPKYPIAIVGGGIVGTSTAMALSKNFGESLVLLEAEETLAAHQTGNNSGVIHSGLYYKPGSSKATNCTAGRTALYEFCEEHGIAHDPCGKIVVATSEKELAVLEMLYKRSVANGLQGIRKIDADEILEFEPHIRGLAGLHVPQTGIVDFPALTRTYATLAERGGATIQLATKLTGIIEGSDGLVLETNRGAIHVKYLINCAGLQCDRIARMAGDMPKMRVVPFRGEYYELVPERQFLIRNLVYPVPDPRFPFLGVHFTRMIHGGVEAGPNAVLAMKREGYRPFDFSAKDVLSYLTYGGFWKMAFRHGGSGMGEIWRSLSKRAFANALRRLLPELQTADIRRAGAGVRAQALGANGKLLDDFYFLESEKMIHVLNAPSPAATASISIGQTIAQKARQRFGLG